LKPKKTKSLSVWHVLRESTVFTVENWKIFGKLFLIPMIVQFGASIFIGSITQVNADTPLVIVPLLISIIIIYLAFSIAGPRWIQHYCKPKSTVRFFQFHKVEWRFFTYLIAVFGILFGLIVLGIIMSALVLVSMGSSSSLLEGFTLPQILAAATTIMVTLGLCLTIWVRLFFVFPAIALSKPTGLKQAWKESRPHWKKLMGLALLIVACLGPLSLIEDRNISLTFIGVLITTVISAIGDICITKFYLASKR
jgi:hypothetical protein